MLYNAIVRQIQRGKTEGLAEKLDLFCLLGKITNEEYTALIGMMEE